MKEIYHKSIANSNTSGEKHTTIPLKIGIKQSCPLSPCLLNIVLEVLAKAIKQLKEIKDIQVREEDIKLSLFTDDIIIYISDPKIYFFGFF